MAAMLFRAGDRFFRYVNGGPLDALESFLCRCILVLLPLMIVFTALYWYRKRSWMIAPALGAAVMIIVLTLGLSSLPGAFLALLQLLAALCCCLIFLRHSYAAAPADEPGAG